MSSIFDKPGHLKPSAMISVAESRFGDAEALCKTGDSGRANGAQHLCGFVIEILLKAVLVQRYPHIAAKRPHQRDAMSDSDRTVWRLIWTSHELSEILDRLPQLDAFLAKRGERAGRPYQQYLKQICATWTIYARYSSLVSTITEAQEMLKRVRELKEVLK